MILINLFFAPNSISEKISLLIPEELLKKIVIM